VNKKIILGIVLLLLVIPLIQAQQSPKLPFVLYGQININNSPAPAGTQITALDSRGNVCGTFTSTNQGLFGLIQCISFNSLEDNAGSNPGEMVIMRVNDAAVSVLLNNTANTVGPLSWQSGVFKNITLVQPPLVCGDNFCDNFETCSSCPQDCGICPSDRPPSEPGAPGPSGPSGPSPPGTPDFGTLRPLPPPIQEEDCVESWSCAGWIECRSDGSQTRECVDLNSCGTNFDRPQIERSCQYIESQNLTPIDREARPRVEQPLTIDICEERMNIFSVQSLSFIFLTSLLIVGKILIKNRSIKKIKKNKDLEELKQLELIYFAKRKAFIFITTVSVLSLIVYLYHYFFLFCEDKYYAHLWLLALFVFLSPIAIYILIEVFKYSEKDMAKKVALLNDTHYKHVLNLVKVVNGQLITSETEISNALYRLDKSSEFKDLLTKTETLRNVYKDISKLYNLYKEDKQASKVEKDLLENISKFEVDEKFKEEAKKYPEIDKLRYNLSMLYKSYEYKQELYDEMIKIENEFDKKFREDKHE
jgi:hypothetical protein